MKICTKCLVEQPLSEFPSSRVGDNQCRTCGNAYRKAWKHEQSKLYRTCISCKKKKLKEDFFNIGGEAYSRVCRSCYETNAVSNSGRVLENILLFEKGLRKCGTCNQVKSIAYFGINKYTSHGINTTCKTCRRVRNRLIKLKLYYNITADQLQDLFNLQEGLCAICHSKISLFARKTNNLTIPQAVIDHCHETDKIRGLLCNNCNRAIGLFQDNIQILISAAKYLKLAHIKLREFRESPEVDNPEPSLKNE